LEDKQTEASDGTGPSPALLSQEGPYKGLTTLLSQEGPHVTHLARPQVSELHHVSQSNGR